MLRRCPCRRNRTPDAGPCEYCCSGGLSWICNHSPSQSSYAPHSSPPSGFVLFRATRAASGMPKLASTATSSTPSIMLGMRARRYGVRRFNAGLRLTWYKFVMEQTSGAHGNMRYHDQSCGGVRLLCGGEHYDVCAITSQPRDVHLPAMIMGVRRQSTTKNMAPTTRTARNNRIR